MKKEKLYICEDIRRERVYRKSYITDEARRKGLTSVKIAEAVKSTGVDFLFCKAFGEIGEKGACGKDCGKYVPRNGKNGCCKNRTFCYEAGDESVLYIT